MTCADCKRTIEYREESYQQDKTGRRLCVECSDKYWDVTRCEPRGCSCSRGGNAITCECRETQPLGRPLHSDDAYAYSVCSKCRKLWQNIDYGCARHQLTCGYPLPAKIETRRAMESHSDAKRRIYR